MYFKARNWAIMITLACVFQAAGIPAHISWNICTDRSSIILGWSGAHDNQLNCHPNWINQWNQLWPANHDNTHGMCISAHFISRDTVSTKSHVTFYETGSVTSGLLSLFLSSNPHVFFYEYCVGSLFHHNRKCQLWPRKSESKLPFNVQN